MTSLGKVLKAGLFMALTAAFAVSCPVAPAVAADGLTWSMAEEIRSHIKEPQFPGYSVRITDFGAVADDNQLDTDAIQKAIQHVNENGGGTVVVPKGTFDTGAITLLSNVNLHLEDVDSILLYTTEINEKNYPVVYSHWEATPLHNYSALIYAKDAENIALTGKGTLNAQSNYDTVWWNWRKKVPVPGTTNMTEPQGKGQKRSRDMNEGAVPVSERIFGDGWFLRPNFIQTINCKNVLLEGVTLLDSPMWQVNPVLCENVIVRGMTLRAHGYNTDCVNPESSNYVLIENNVFDSGDDCIAIKSGRDRDGRELNTPSQNILVFNNHMMDGHGGIAMGSEMSGSIRNVFADGNHFDSPKLTYPLRFKTNARRGGVIENVYLRNSNIARIDQAVVHGTMLYSEGDNGEYLPAFRNIIVENVTSNSGLYGIFLEALKDSPITGLVFRNLTINGVQYPLRAMNWASDVVMDNVVINGRRYPAPTEARILGVPAPRETLQVDALLTGGNSAELSYDWEMSDSRSGAYVRVGEGRVFTVPFDAAGKYVRVAAVDAEGNSITSIPYKVLRAKTAGGLPAGSKAGLKAARLATRGILGENDPIDPDRDITRLELARMLARLWDLDGPSKDSQISDLPKGGEDWRLASAVVERGMMTLDRNFNANLTDVNPDAAKELKGFTPNGPVTREEMGTIVMMSCGVSYKNASNTYDSTYTDGADISNVNLTDIERGTTLGFWDNRGDFHPKKNMTYSMVLDSLNRVADFAGK